MTIDPRSLKPLQPSPALSNIDLSKVDGKLNMQLAIASTKPDFNNASFSVFIRTKAPIQPGAYLDQNNSPIPGVTVNGTKAATIQTGTVTGSALAALTHDPNLVVVSGATQLSPC